MEFTAYEGEITKELAYHGYSRQPYSRSTSYDAYRSFAPHAH